MLVDITKGWNHLHKHKDKIIQSYTAEMTHFPLCCSTGVLNNVTATTLSSHSSATWGPDAPPPTTNNIYIPKDADLVQMLRQTATNRYYLWPVETAGWLCMGLIYRKCRDGLDDGGDCGYSGYKAAQIIIADRLNEDKRSGSNFNNYNMTFSCDNLMDYMEELDLGEVLVSTPREGAHQSRVRAAIFTPDMDLLKVFFEEKTQLVREHILATNEWLSTRVQQPDGKEESLW